MEINYSKDLFLENTKYNSIGVDDSKIGLYVADFETSKVNNIDNDVFVYATGLMDVYDDNNKCLHTNNLDDFIESIFNLPYLESEIYFHNLSFDVVFLMINLFEKGFSQIYKPF